MTDAGGNVPTQSYYRLVATPGDCTDLARPYSSTDATIFPNLDYNPIYTSFNIATGITFNNPADNGKFVCIQTRDATGRFESPYGSASQNRHFNFTKNVTTALNISGTPLNVTINQASTQVDPQLIGATTPVRFTATFNQNIDPATLVNADFTRGGTATGCTTTGFVANPTGQTQIYDINLNCGSNVANNTKTITLSMLAGKVNSAAGFSNLASTSTDNSVTLTTTVTPSPAAPAITTTAGSPSSATTPVVTNNTSPAIAGTGTSGNTITVKDALGNTICITTVPASGNWSCTPATPLAPGNYDLTATQTNPTTTLTSVASPVAKITIDTTPPAAPTCTTASNGNVTCSPVTPGDTVTIPGTACTPSPATATGVVTCVPTNPAVPPVGPATTTDPAGNTTPSPVTPPATAPTVNPTNGSTVNGTGTPGNTIVIKDSLGNVIPCTPSPVIVSATGTWSCTPTTTPPNGTVISVTQTTPGGSVSATVNVTVDSTGPIVTINTLVIINNANKAAYTVEGTCTIGDGPVTINFEGIITTTPCSATGTYSTVMDLSSLSDTPPNLLMGVSQTDTSGSTGNASKPAQKDTVAPTPAVITGPAAPVSTTTPTLTGTGTPGDTVTIKDTSGNPILGCVNIVIPASGTYTCTPTTPLAQGPNSLTPITTDPAGNISTGLPFTVNVDTLAPVAPTITTTAGQPASSTSAVLTNSSTPTISGTGEVGATITVKNGATTICTAVVNSSGIWTCTPSPALINGITYNLTATQTDLANNVSPASPVALLTVDTVAPAVVISDPNPTIEPTNIIPLEFIATFSEAINVATLTPSDITITSNDSSGYVDSIVSLGGNQYKIIVRGVTNLYPVINNVVVTINAGLVQDIAGNTNSAATQATGANKGFMIPPPNVNYLVTSNHTPTLTGLCGAGHAIKVIVNSVTYNTTCSATGTWSIPVTTSIPDGKYNLSIEDTTIGGLFDSTNNELIIDSVAPTTPTVTPLTTSDTTPTISGTCETGTNLAITINTVVYNQTCAAGVWSITIPTSNALPDGSYNINVVSTDAAGNTSSDATTNELKIDTTPPTALLVTQVGEDIYPGTIATTDNTPTIIGTCEIGSTVKAVVTPTGEVITAVCSLTGTFSITPTTPIPDGLFTLAVTQTDLAGNTSPATTINGTIDTTPPTPAVLNPAGPTNDTTPTLTGTGTPGDTVTIKDASGNPILGCVNIVIPASGTYTCTPTNPLPLGNNPLTATTCDPAGNCINGPAVNINIDTTPPSSPTISVTSPNNDNTPTLSGTGEVGATVTVKDENGNSLCTAVGQSNGTWTCTLTIPLTDGPHTLSVTQKDPAGNTSPQAAAPVNIDTTAPSAPVITGPVSGNTTTNDKPTFTGTGEVGAIVKVYDEFNNLVCQTNVDSSGNWTCAPAFGQGEGTHKYIAIQTDSAGNTSPSSTPPVILTLDIDTDGVTTAEENAAPNNGDNNADGILDSMQQNVTSKPNPNMAGKYATLMVDPTSQCADIRDYYFKSEPQLAIPDPSFDYPLGLFGFKLKCATPGASANVTIILDKQYDTSKWIYRKYNNITKQYFDASQYITYGTMIIGGNTVTTIKFVAKDGGPLDEDGLANGEFVDPNGPAIAVVSVPEPIVKAVQTITNLLRTGGTSSQNIGEVLSMILLCVFIIVRSTRRYKK